MLNTPATTLRFANADQRTPASYCSVSSAGAASLRFSALLGATGLSSRPSVQLLYTASRSVAFAVAVAFTSHGPSLGSGSIRNGALKALDHEVFCPPTPLSPIFH